VAVGTGVAFSHLGFGNVCFAWDTVPSLVLSLVYITVGHEAPEYFLNDFFMPGSVVLMKSSLDMIKNAPKPLEIQHDLIAKLFWRDASFLSDCLDLLTMFIGAGKKPGIFSPGLVPAGQDVSRYGRVGVPDMGNIVDVVDRCGDIEIFFGHLYYLPGTVLKNVPFYSVSWDTILY
jgi:hypothetical protein